MNQDRRKRYAFECIAVGSAIVIEADAVEQQRVRMAVSRYNKATHASLRCHKMPDGTMQVCNPMRLAPSELRPTKAEFVLWLASIAPGMRYSIAPNQSQRDLRELQQWIGEYSEAELVEIEIAWQGESLLLTRK